MSEDNESWEGSEVISIPEPMIDVYRRDDIYCLHCAGGPFSLILATPLSKVPQWREFWPPVHGMPCPSCENWINVVLYEDESLESEEDEHGG